ncbi:MAG: Serine acetyltransferase [uncultured Adhaeribacter sp.]|uniref:Serine acetyltransferase n=1 Tax=uncultured Adhaeribacter sp. TaxID=448109 RepID=A0A6J4HUT0_9BACT|nr:MAG: Serine acetyltransferase [uncultured Adhaeribacter sp.]
MAILIRDYIQTFAAVFPEHATALPWLVTKNLANILVQKISTLTSDYLIQDNIAIHKTAGIEEGAILKAPLIISENCQVGAHAYLRGGVYLGAGTRVGPGCEIKTTVIMAASAVAHFNFLGDSIIGSYVNFEAGAVVANHYNERENKHISVLVNGQLTATNTEKFGALVGDYAKIGANAVLSPGTVLPAKAVVKRSELVQQTPD